MSRKYRPSNGIEGVHFEHEHCMQCINCDPDPTGEKQCMIWCRAIMHDTIEPEYPTEWTYDENDKPTCTAWVKWDWGDDDDRNEPPEKPGPPSDDPNQLLMPFDIWDLLGITDEILVTKTVIIEKEVVENGILR